MVVEQQPVGAGRGRGPGPGYGKGQGSGAGVSAGRGAGMRCCETRRRRGGAGGGALTEPAVVAALHAQGGHGYDLRKTIVEMTDGCIDVDPGGLYRVLRRLEDEGFVRSSWADGDAGPQRREYELTEKAGALAADWVEHLRERERLASMLASLLEMGHDDMDDKEDKKKDDEKKG